MLQLKTHLVLVDYTPEENTVCFEGTPEECQRFVSAQRKLFNYRIVPMSISEVEFHPENQWYFEDRKEKSTFIKVIPFAIMFFLFVIILATCKAQSKNIPVSTVSAVAGDGTNSDTLRMSYVTVPYDAILDRDGSVKKVFYKSIKVKSGYIIRKRNGNYVINSKEMYPDYFKF